MNSACIPVFKLFLSAERTVALFANGQFCVLDSTSGTILHASTNDTNTAKRISELGLPIAASLDESFRKLVVAFANKRVIVWSIADFSVLSEREAPKKPTDVYLSRDGEEVFVADKFGDVHSYSAMSSQEKAENDALTSNVEKKQKKRSEDESLLLGHVSLLTAVMLTKDQRYIITADRDEHIRVSWYPEAYTIERYCLGHQKFVSALHIPASNPALLVSGGGDPELRIWDWMAGTTTHRIPIADSVIPEIKVKRRKGGRRSEEDEGNEDMRVSSRQRRKQQKKSKKSTENDASADSLVANESMQTADMNVDGPNKAESPEDENVEEEERLVLAVQKIETATFDSTELLFFSVCGATSLFYCTFPKTSEPPPLVHKVMLSHPILDFAILPDSNEIWVAIDLTWSPGASSDSALKAVKTLHYIDGKLSLVDLTSRPDLLSSINSIDCSQYPLPADTDLYSALVTLPKNIGAEADGEGADEAPSEKQEKKLSGKELGRMKAKKAALAVAQKEALSGTVDESDRTVKRMKSETS